MPLAHNSLFSTIVIKIDIANEKTSWASVYVCRTYCCLSLPIFVCTEWNGKIGASLETLLCQDIYKCMLCYLSMHALVVKFKHKIEKFMIHEKDNLQLDFISKSNINIIYYLYCLFSISFAFHFNFHGFFIYLFPIKSDGKNGIHDVRVCVGNLLYAMVNFFDCLFVLMKLSYTPRFCGSISS